MISLDTTPYYHCVSRCVRRAFLCGRDECTGQCFEHRRQWIEDRLLELAEVFALNVCAFAVMSNHFHLVLHIDKARADSWTLSEVVERWHQLCKGSTLSQRFVRGESLDATEMDKVAEVAEVWRARLMDISWFMRTLNESIAREANREDQCTGRFWEGRVKSQALVDWSGRILRDGKRGAIDDKLPPILERLQIDPQHWLYLNRNFESRFKSLVGAAHSVRTACQQLGKRWAHGVRDCERYLSPPAAP